MPSTVNLTVGLLPFTCWLNRVQRIPGPAAAKCLQLSPGDPHTIYISFTRLI